MHSTYILIIRPSTLRVCGLFVCPFHRFRKNNEKFFRQVRIADWRLVLRNKRNRQKQRILLLARKLKKFRKTGASLETMLDVAHCLDRSASFVLGLDDFPDSYEQDLNCKNIAPNLRRFVSKNAHKMFYLKKHGFLQTFPSFKNWLNGKTIPNSLNFVRLSKALGLSAEDLLRPVFSQPRPTDTDKTE